MNDETPTEIPHVETEPPAQAQLPPELELASVGAPAGEPSGSAEDPGPALADEQAHDVTAAPPDFDAEYIGALQGRIAQLEAELSQANERYTAFRGNVDEEIVRTEEYAKAGQAEVAELTTKYDELTIMGSRLFVVVETILRALGSSLQTADRSYSQSALEAWSTTKRRHGGA